MMSACTDHVVGPPGPVGPSGPAGRDGNANVFSLNMTFSMADAFFNGAVASVPYAIPELTPSVVDDGAVLVFFRDQGTWTALPFIFAYDNPDLQAVDFTVTFGYGYDDEFLEVFYEASAEGVTLENMPDRELKAVIIDGFPAAKSPIDLTNYEVVKAYFGLAD
jgi:hypothetical protein